MKLLIITQKVDKHDPILGFFHRWLEEFSRTVEHVVVVCLFEGEHSLPGNVTVLSLGKEYRVSRIQYVYRFFYYIWNQRDHYDAVFIHMNQIYAILGGCVWKFLHKPVALWYTHKQVSWSLRTAVLFVDYMFSASQESFRLPTKKLHILGHGIDTKVFCEISRPENTRKKLLTVGRVAPVKNIHMMIDVVKNLHDKGISVDFDIVGNPIYPADEVYKDTLQKKIHQYGLEKYVRFLGTVSHEKTPALYQNADIFLNLSDTGSMDKVVLEAMACGLKIVTSNDAFQNILDTEYLVRKDVISVTEGVRRVMEKVYDKNLSLYVQKNHNLTRLIPTIIQYLT